MRRRRTLIFVVIAIAAFLLLSYVIGPFMGPPPETDRADVAKVEAGPDLAPRPPDKPLPPSVAGRVVDENGKGLRGVSVLIVTLDDGKRHEATAKTDPNGRYEEKTLPAGEVFFVEAIKPGYPVFRMRPEGVHILPDATVTLDIAMPETFDLNGHVKSRSGVIVKGARVSFGKTGYGATSDGRGKFRVKGIPSHLLRKGGTPPRLSTTAPGYVDNSIDLGLDGRNSNRDDIQVVLEKR
jgi:Carboxypeptidase regulatory-like domain